MVKSAYKEAGMTCHEALGFTRRKKEVNHLLGITKVRKGKKHRLPAFNLKSNANEWRFA